MSQFFAKLKVTIVSVDIEESFSLEGAQFIFGRSANSDINIKDPSFSRSHFRVAIKDQSLQIEDLGSANGTYINKQRMPKGSASPLHSRDIVSVDSSETKIIFDKFEIYGVKDTASEKGNDLTSLMEKIINEAQLKAQQIIKEAELQSAEKKIKTKEECQNILNETKILASLQKKEALQDASREFIELTRIKLLKTLEEENQIRQIELNEKYLAEEQRIANLAKEKSDFLEDEFINKKREIDELDEKIDLKRQKRLEELDLEYNNRKLILQNAEEELESALIKKRAMLSQVDEDIELKNRQTLEAYKHEYDAKKIEIAKLEQLYEAKKIEQTQMMTVQVENKKIELQNEISEYDLKMVNCKLEFKNLFDHYAVKKNEQANLIASNNLLLEKLNAEIRILEKQLIETRVKHDIQIESNKQSLALSNVETIKLNNSIKEQEIRNTKLAQQKDQLNSLILELHEKKNNEENSIKTNNEVNLKILDEIQKSSILKETLTPQLTILKSQVLELNKKIETANGITSRLESEHAQKIAGLEAKHLEKKNALKLEMENLKSSEEKKLQGLMHSEMARINKLKEESLRLVVDLENSITKEISISSAKIFTETIGVAKYREIAPQFEKALRSSLQSGVLKLLHNELNPSSTNKDISLSSSKKAWKPFAIGMSLSALAFGLVPYMYQKVQIENDPIHQEMVAEQARTQAQLAVRKFSPEKVRGLGSSFTKSIIYTEGFYETYALENFRSELIKQGSVYLYKNWQIEEEKSIESYAIIFSLIDALKERRENINPEFEKRDIDKMAALEKESMKKVESLLGNAVRVEAALKFQARFYHEFLNQQAVAKGN